MARVTSVKKDITIRLTLEIINWLEEESENQGKKRNQFILEILQTYKENQKKS